MTKEQIELLLKGGYITPETSRRMVQHYADGGVVAMPLKQEAPAQPPQPSFQDQLTEMSPIAGAGYGLVKGLLFDQRPPGEFQPGGGGITESMSPIDLITPGMVTAPVRAAAQGVAKAAPAIGRGMVAAGKEVVKRSLDPTGAVGGLTVQPRMVMPGMYSKAEQLIAEKMGGSASPQQIMGILKEAKPEELEYLGISQFLEGKPKVSKPELLAHIQQNLPQIQETLKMDESARHLRWTLPGGEQYQERLYALPVSQVTQLQKRLDLIDEKIRSITSDRGSMLDIEANPQGAMAQRLEYLNLEKQEIQQKAEIELQAGAGKQRPSYLTRPFEAKHHFKEQNVLAHSRAKERIGPSGEKTLFAEELQSDWHQAGREKGYAPTPEQKKALDAESIELTQKIDNVLADTTRPESERLAIAKQLQDRRKEIVNLLTTNVPDAPMKKSWHEFLSKRLLHDAAESGAGSVSWTSGKTQAERYGLDMFFDSLSVVDIEKSAEKNYRSVSSGFWVRATDKNGRVTVDEWVPNRAVLEQTIGKDAAEKVLQEKTLSPDYKSYNVHKLSGADLKVENTGMRGFYDQIIPQYMAKLGKKFNVKPKKVKIEGVDDEVWHMEITPEMREEILKKGFPLFTGAGIIGGASQAQASQGDKAMFTKEQADMMLQRGLISPQTYQRITGAQGYADGGEVMPAPLPTPAEEITSAPVAINPGAPIPEQFATMPAPMPAPTPIPQMTPAGAAGVPLPGQYGPPSPMAQTPPATERAIVPGMPGAPAPAGFQMPGEASMMKAAGLEAKAAQDIGSAAERAYEGLQGQLKKERDTYAQIQGDIQARLKTLDTELMSGQVNPNRVWSEASTGAQIGAVLGMLFSGIGAGVTGKENMAVANINKMIDRDIEAQKANIQNKQSLFSKYLTQLGDSRQAEAAARLHLVQAAEVQVKQAQAKAATPQAQAAFEKTRAQMEQQKAQYTIELTKMMGNASLYGMGGGEGGIPFGRESFYQASDPELQKRIVPVADKQRSYLARSDQEAAELRKMESAYSKARKMLTELKQYSSLGARLSPEQRAKADAIVAKLPPLLNELNGYARFTEMEQELLEKTFSAPGVLNAIFAPNTKTNALLKDLDTQMQNKRAVMLQGYKPVTSFEPGAK